MALPKPYQPGSITRDCDQLNTHGIARKSSIFCERVRDFAVQAFYDREKGRPMKVFVEDGSAGAHITNVAIKRIYEKPQIATPKAAETLGRETCNEMMASKGSAE